MIQFQKNTQMDRRMDRPYFIQPFRLMPGVQKEKKEKEERKTSTHDTWCPTLSLIYLNKGCGFKFMKNWSHVKNVQWCFYITNQKYI